MFERYRRRNKALAKVLLICLLISGISLLYLFTPVFAQGSENETEEEEDEEGGVCCLGLLLIIIFILGIPAILVLTYLITKTVKYAWKH